MKKRYWLRSGMRFGLFSVATIVVPMIRTGDYFEVYVGLPVYILQMILSIPVFLISNPFNLFEGILGNCKRGEILCELTFIGDISLVVFWFLAGSFLGWLYGKIKSRRSNLTPSA